MNKVMRFCFVLICLFAGTCLMADTMEWSLVTNTGKTICLKDVSYLVVADKGKTFSVIKTDNSMENGVRCVTFKQISIPSTAVLQSTVISSVVAYPNPVISSLNLMGLGKNEQVNVVSLSGVVVMSVLSDGDKTNLNVSSLPSGAYLLKTRGTMIKFIKR